MSTKAACPNEHTYYSRKRLVTVFAEFVNRPTIFRAPPFARRPLCICIASFTYDATTIITTTTITTITTITTNATTATATTTTTPTTAAVDAVKKRELLIYLHHRRLRHRCLALIAPVYETGRKETR